MVSISVSMICENEERVIARAIRNVISYVDEIVLVDGGSEDKTIEIAKSFPKTRIFKIPFERDFAKQKNNAIARCIKDWILVMDADETFENDLLENLQRLTTEGYDSFAFARKTRIDGFLHNIIEPDYQIRFWKNNLGIRYGGKIHESPVGMKALAKCNLYINHDKTFEMQEEDNKLYWSMGQRLPDDVRLIDGKYVRINQGEVI